MDWSHLHTKNQSPAFTPPIIVYPSPPKNKHLSGPSVLVVGNEGSGLSDAVRAELRAGGVTGGRIPLAGERPPWRWCLCVYGYFVGAAALGLCT